MTGKSRGEELMCAYLDIMLPLEHVDNHRPDWLRNSITGFNLELDRYYPIYNIAFEFQGDQHYRQTDLEWRNQQRNDELKRVLCAKHHTLLVELRAIDLQTAVMLRKLMQLGKMYKRNKAGIAMPSLVLNKKTIPHHDKRFWQLDHEATTYRKYLNERFPNNVTAHLKGKANANRKKPWVDTHAEKSAA